MRCHACDQLNSPDARYCTACGASLALTAWAQQPAPARASSAAVRYAPPQPLPRATVAVPAPGTMPSMVNNVTVTQTTPPAPATPAVPPALTVATGHTGSLGTLLRALYFLGSGLALGVVWTAAVQATTAPYSNQPWAIPLAIALTILLMLLNFVVLNRMARRR